MYCIFKKNELHFYYEIIINVFNLFMKYEYVGNDYISLYYNNKKNLWNDDADNNVHGDDWDGNVNDNQ